MNQEKAAEGAGLAGITRYLGRDQDLSTEALLQALSEWFDHPQESKKMEAQALEAVDGIGVDRVVAALLGF